MSDINDKSETADGYLFFDENCRFCRRSIDRLRPWLRRVGVAPVPFENGAAESEMRLRWHDGREFGGADAAIFLTSHLWWTRPFHWIAGMPGVHGLAHAIYRQIAARRHCLNGSCELPTTPTARKRWPLGFLWLIVGLMIALSCALLNLLHPEASPWTVMWTLAATQWLGFKFVAWSRAPTRPVPAFWAWVGMDAHHFLERGKARRSQPIAGFSGVVFLLFGAVLILVSFLPLAAFERPEIAGVLGMAGLISTLHFGLFALFAIGWNRLGYPVAPIMKTPLFADSLADFWGARWNRAFSDVARIGVFRPLVRRFGIVSGTLAGFLLSGIAHELVISFPARAGWGLPTLYFLIQGLGVIADRRLLAKNGPALSRRLFTWLFILLPAPLLFHEPFLTTVITPGFTHLLKLIP